MPRGSDRSAGERLFSYWHTSFLTHVPFSLRLAAKCFDKAGEPARKNHALACLTFAEMDNQDMSKLRGKKAVLDHQQKLYEITEQLLEARDVGFLDKAALCLLRTGEQEEYTGGLARFD